ncbi:MAG: sulfite reductase subunit alpha [Proteobacteria bacterium]|nr:sulfite reductase subunit alpha [Pseudomonadota bacterium]
MTTAMTGVPLLPETAPCSPTQRAWLNGFFAGLLGAEGSQLLASAGTQVAVAEPEDLPWHDPTLPMDERLKLAAGRPRARVLMAAMAQLDCGQCGYLCQTYAEALAGGQETNLSLCVPGSKDTTRALRRLLGDAVPASTASAPIAARRAPAEAVRFEANRRLNGEGSDKDTRHVVFHLNGSKLAYEVGDSFGVHVANCTDFVQAVVATLGVPGSREFDCFDGNRRRLDTALGTALDIGRPSDAVVELMAAHATDADEARRLRAIAIGEDGVAPVDPDLLDLLLAFPSARPPIAVLVRALSPLQPRLYSIASSPKVHAGEVHLTVAVVRYERNGRRRKGVASTFLAERVQPQGELGAFVQASHGFRLPKDPAAPVVMIGPGTGIAPFRAFLAERRAVGAGGRNWLFFGDRHRDHDFLYRDEMMEWQADGLLTRLDTAFSRNQRDKIYVQHRMRENGAELWSWLQDGAYLYVCGDAKRMARDVDQALIDVVAAQGAMTATDAKAWVAGLARDKRYQRDVY